VILGRGSVRSGAYSIMQAWCFTTMVISSRYQRMASPRIKSAYCLLSTAGLFVALIGGSAASFAQVASDGTAIMNTIDQAVRTADFGRAAMVLRKFAESRNSEAQYRLASLYRIGRGVPQDDLLAFKWMKAAAEQNHANAQFNLARMYLAGRGAAPDVGAAKVWLQKAAAQQHDEAAKLLAEISARRTVEANPNEAAPAYEARPRPARIETSSQRGPATAPRHGAAEILDAAWRGQTDAIKRLISSGADISAKDDDGNTALLRAASAGKIDAVNTLLSARAEVNAENHLGERPLLLAAAGGHADIVDALLRRGADLAARTRRGDSALTLAVRHCHQPVVKL
jgi:uncharacterized protein